MASATTSAWADAWQLVRPCPGRHLVPRHCVRQPRPAGKHLRLNAGWISSSPSQRISSTAATPQPAPGDTHDHDSHLHADTGLVALPGALYQSGEASGAACGSPDRQRLASAGGARSSPIPHAAHTVPVSDNTAAPGLPREPIDGCASYPPSNPWGSGASCPRTVPAALVHELAYGAGVPAWSRESPPRTQERESFLSRVVKDQQRHWRELSHRGCYQDGKPQGQPEPQYLGRNGNQQQYLHDQQPHVLNGQPQPQPLPQSQPRHRELLRSWQVSRALQQGDAAPPGLDQAPFPVPEQGRGDKWALEAFESAGGNRRTRGPYGRQAAPHSSEGSSNAGELVTGGLPKGWLQLGSSSAAPEVDGAAGTAMGTGEDDASDGGRSFGNGGDIFWWGRSDGAGSMSGGGHASVAAATTAAGPMSALGAGGSVWGSVGGFAGGGNLTDAEPQLGRERTDSVSLAPLPWWGGVPGNYGGWGGFVERQGAVVAAVPHPVADPTAAAADPTAAAAASWDNATAPAFTSAYASGRRLTVGLDGRGFTPAFERRVSERNRNEALELVTLSARGRKGAEEEDLLFTVPESVGAADGRAAAAAAAAAAVAALAGGRRSGGDDDDGGLLAASTGVGGPRSGGHRGGHEGPMDLGLQGGAGGFDDGVSWGDWGPQVDLGGGWGGFNLDEGPSMSTEPSVRKDWLTWQRSGVSGGITRRGGSAGSRRARRTSATSGRWDVDGGDGDGDRGLVAGGSEAARVAAEGAGGFFYQERRQLFDDFEGWSDVNEWPDVPGSLQQREEERGAVRCAEDVNAQDRALRVAGAQRSDGANVRDGCGGGVGGNDSEGAGAAATAALPVTGSASSAAARSESGGGGGGGRSGRAAAAKGGGLSPATKGGAGGGGDKAAVRRAEERLRRAAAAMSARIVRRGISVTFPLPPAASTTPVTSPGSLPPPPPAASRPAAPSAGAAAAAGGHWASVPLSYNFGPLYKLLEERPLPEEVSLPEDLIQLARAAVRGSAAVHRGGNDADMDSAAGAAEGGAGGVAPEPSSRLEGGSGSGSDTDWDGGYIEDGTPAVWAVANRPRSRGRQRVKGAQRGALWGGAYAWAGTDDGGEVSDPWLWDGGGDLLPGCTAYTLPGGFEVLLVQRAISLGPAIAWLRASLDEDMTLGIDTEWPPAFEARQSTQLAMLQIASPSRVLLLHVAQMRKQATAPSGPLHALLSDACLTWVGCGWCSGDRAAMQEAFGPQPLPPRVVDVQSAARAAGWPRVGLLGLVNDLLGVAEFTKPRSVTRCNWARAAVTGRQVRYAAIDALLPPLLLRQLRLFAAMPGLRCSFCKQAMHAPIGLQQHEPRAPRSATSPKTAGGEAPDKGPLKPRATTTAPHLACDHCGRTFWKSPEPVGSAGASPGACTGGAGDTTAPTSSPSSSRSLTRASAAAAAAAGEAEAAEVEAGAGEVAAGSMGAAARAAGAAEAEAEAGAASTVDSAVAGVDSAPTQRLMSNDEPVVESAAFVADVVESAAFVADVALLLSAVRGRQGPSQRPRRRLFCPHGSEDYGADEGGGTGGGEAAKAGVATAKAGAATAKVRGGAAKGLQRRGAAEASSSRRKRREELWSAFELASPAAAAAVAMAMSAGAGRAEAATAKEESESEARETQADSGGETGGR